MLQALKTVHLPLSPSDAQLMLPLLDWLTQYLARCETMLYSLTHIIRLLFHFAHSTFPGQVPASTEPGGGGQGFGRVSADEVGFNLPAE